MSSKRLATIILIVFVITISLLVVFSFRLDHKLNSLLDDTLMKDTIRFEIIKSLLSLLVVIIIGGSLTYLFKLREETQKSDANKKDDQRKQEQIRIEIRLEYFK
jgi:heme/copper-type cytochrome/quinol oxidase subunit 2